MTEKHKTERKAVQFPKKYEKNFKQSIWKNILVMINDSCKFWTYLSTPTGYIATMFVLLS